MKIEDYSQYYIQGSDHYLLSKDLFEEVMYELDNWREQCYDVEERIDKAIEYIENNSHYYNADSEIMFSIEEEKEETFCKDLLEILKGDSNEDI